MKVAILVVNILTFLLLVYVAFIKPVPEKGHFFATTGDGQLVRMLPLDEPYVSQEEIKKWVRKAVAETLSLSSGNYRDKLYYARRFYSPMGWDELTRSLQSLFAFLEVQDCEMSISVGEVTISRQGVEGSVYIWEVSAPVRYETNCQVALSPVIKMTIGRSTWPGTPQGLVILGWTL